MKYTVAHFIIEGTENDKIYCLEEQELSVARDILSSTLCDIGFDSFEDEDHGLAAYIYDVQLDENMIKHVLTTDWSLKNWHIEYKLEPVEDINWNETWENEGFDPIVVNDMCAIYDAKHPERASFEIKNLPLAVGIEAKMAFGTGTHETTRMIVSILTEMDLSNKNVLDCGCGTGILSIVASKQGARKVVAYDIDEWSVRNTMHNMELNKADNISVMHGDSTVLSGIEAYFDVVLANINRNILLNDMPHFKKVLAPEGMIIISGFYEEDTQILKGKAEEIGLELTSQQTDNKWTCMLFTNRPLHQL